MLAASSASPSVTVTASPARSACLPGSRTTAVTWCPRPAASSMNVRPKVPPAPKTTILLMSAPCFRRRLVGQAGEEEVGVGLRAVSAVVDIERAVPDGDRAGVREPIRRGQHDLVAPVGVDHDDLVGEVERGHRVGTGLGTGEGEVVDAVQSTCDSLDGPGGTVRLNGDAQEGAVLGVADVDGARVDLDAVGTKETVRRALRAGDPRRHAAVGDRNPPYRAQQGIGHVQVLLAAVERDAVGESGGRQRGEARLLAVRGDPPDALEIRVARAEGGVERALAVAVQPERGACATAVRTGRVR